MNSATITLAESRLTFRPGEELRGTASWQLERSPQRMEVRLCWFTDGIAIPEAEMVDCCAFDRPLATDTQPFKFILPRSPYSFRGQLTALEWALELVAVPGGSLDRIVFSLSPRGGPCRLVGDAEPNVSGVPKAA
jgi:hypothetical protein